VSPAKEKEGDPLTTKDNTGEEEETRFITTPTNPGRNRGSSEAKENSRAARVSQSPGKGKRGKKEKGREIPTYTVKRRGKRKKRGEKHTEPHASRQSGQKKVGPSAAIDTPEKEGIKGEENEKGKANWKLLPVGEKGKLTLVIPRKRRARQGEKEKSTACSLSRKKDRRETLPEGKKKKPITIATFGVRLQEEKIPLQVAQLTKKRGRPCRPVPSTGEEPARTPPGGKEKKKRSQRHQQVGTAAGKAKVHSGSNVK